MKTTTLYGLVLAVAAVGGAAWVFGRSTPPATSDATPAETASVSGAALVGVRLPATLSVKAASGKSYFEAVCASCHGINAAGQDGAGPPLVHKIYESSHHGDAAFAVAVRNGARQHHWSFGRAVAPVQDHIWRHKPQPSTCDARVT